MSNSPDILEYSTAGLPTREYMAKTSVFRFVCCTGQTEHNFITSTIAFSEIESLDHTLIKLPKRERDVARSYTMPALGIYN